MRRRAGAAFFIVAIVLSGSLGYFAGTIGQKEAMPKVMTTYVTQTTTIGEAGGISTSTVALWTTQVSTVVVTQVVSSTVKPGNVVIATGSGSAEGLQLVLELKMDGNRTYHAYVREFNSMASPNNVTAAFEWPIGMDFIYPNPASVDLCGENEGFPAGFVVLEGYYGLNNYTQGPPLQLTYPVFKTICTFETPVAWGFKPSSSVATDYIYGGQAYLTENVTCDAPLVGYWVGDTTAGLVHFKGMYTVVAGDEWGAVVIEHFNTSSD